MNIVVEKSTNFVLYHGQAKLTDGYLTINNLNDTRHTKDTCFIVPCDQSIFDVLSQLDGFIGYGEVSFKEGVIEITPLGQRNILQRIERKKEEIAKQVLEEKKEQRKKDVSSLVVTSQSGKAFDGNEDAQNRMSRAVNAMDESDTLPWVLADNSIAQVTRAELREALRLAGAAMSEIWVQPYTT